MQTVTVTCPTIGLEAYFTFKEPMTRSLQNRLGVSSSQILLKVSAINEIKEMLQSELRDPFLEAYGPAGIEQAQYNQDLIDNIQILTFKYTTPSGAIKYVRVPMTYVTGYDSVVDIAYLSKTLVVDLGPQYQDLDLTPLHPDLVDFIASRTGITPTLKEVSIGEVSKITSEEHALRESLRTNTITVRKTVSAELEELRLKYQNLTTRLQQLNIALG
jgi:hypothetical protein